MDYLQSIATTFHETSRMKPSAQSRVLYAFLILAILVPSICFAWSGKVVSVTDGDTLKVLHDGKEEKIRLYGIDTPE